MKTLAMLLAYLAVANSATFAQRTKTFRPGDTIWPGSRAWIQAGSPHNSATGDSTVLVCGADGQLHPIGCALAAGGQTWIVTAPENPELVRLEQAVQTIMRESPDRIVPKPKGRHAPAIALRDTGYNPYKAVMHWADSIAEFYNDQWFLEEMQQFYRSPQTLGVTPWDNTLDDADADT